MKTLLCILLLSAAAFGQMGDVKTKDHGEKHGCQGETGNPSFPGVLLAPSADQTILGAHALIFSDPANPDFTVQFSIDPTGTFSPITTHSGLAEGADYYTHADAGFRAPYINLYKSRGTRASPTPVTFTGYELDSIGGINFGGWDGSTYFAGSAAIYSQTDEDWTPTSHGGHISIYATNPNEGHTQQVAQFGGLGPNHEPNENIIFYRGLSFHGALSGDPSLIPTSNPPTIRVKKADGSGDAAFTTGSLTITIPHTPATAFNACVAGTIAWDANFVYVCVATDMWRRSALAAW